MANNMYYSILTMVGTEKLAQAIITEIPVKLTTIAVGDGNGQFYSPTPDQVQLKRETWRGDVNDLRSVEDADNHVLTEGVVPTTVGGWTVREVGLFDDAGDLIAICNYPDTIKPLPTSGSGKQLYIQIILVIDNVAALELIIDDSIVIANRKYVDDLDKKHRADLASPAGAGMSGLIQGGTVQGAIQYVTPELFKKSTDANHDNAVKAALASGYPIVMDGDYILSDNIHIPAGTKIKGMGTITQKSTGSFLWTKDLRLSNYPVFIVDAPDITIESITIISKFEAISIAKGGDNCILRNIRAGGTDSERAIASGIAAFNFNNLIIDGCIIRYIGNPAVWSASENRILAGVGRGIDLGGGNLAKINNCNTDYIGENGIFWYGVNDVAISFCNQFMCGQSGVQFSPSPDKFGAKIVGNTARLCCADSIDVRWTGAGVLRADLDITACSNYMCGFLYGNTNYPGRDGSGIATLAHISHFTVSTCHSNNSAGTGVYIDGCTDGIVSGCVVYNDVTSSAGMWCASSINRVILSKNIIRSKGNALGFGGSMSITDMAVMGNHLESFSSNAISAPNNTLTRFKSENNTIIGNGTINLRWDTSCDNITYTGNASNAVYMSLSYTRHRALTVSGATSESLVLQQGASDVLWRDCGLSNSGSGPTFKMAGSTSNTVLSGNRIWNTNAAGYTALQIDDASSDIKLDNNNIYGAGTYAILTTGLGTPRLFQNSNKIVGVQSYAGNRKPYDAQYQQRTT